MGTEISNAIVQKILDLSKEAAEMEAIKFAEWIAKSEWKHKDGTNEIWQNETFVTTTPGLYKLYLTTPQP